MAIPQRDVSRLLGIFALQALGNIEEKEGRLEQTEFNEVVQVEYAKVSQELIALEAGLRITYRRDAIRAWDSFFGKTVEECVGTIGLYIEPNRYKMTPPETRDHALAMAFAKFIAIIQHGIGTDNPYVFRRFLKDPALGHSIIRLGDYLKQLKISTEPFKRILGVFRRDIPKFIEDDHIILDIARSMQRRDYMGTPDISIVRKKCLLARTQLFDSILQHF